MNFKTDPIPPQSLQSVQEWFASIITHPLNKNNGIRPKTPHGTKIIEEAKRYISPSPALRPYQRIQIYNQQYWWRLLKAMQENFPLVTRFFGYQEFNEVIAVPYLCKYPPSHWSLNLLGQYLSKWISEEYKAPDQHLIHDAAHLDWVFLASFFAPKKPPLDLNLLNQSNPEHLLTCTFYLQPYIHLFKWNYDLLHFRETFLQQEVEYWINHDFPPLLKDKTYYFIFYRTGKNALHWKEISAGEYLFLRLLQEGSSIEKVCEHLEQKETVIYEQAVQHLQIWLQDWVSRHWLTLEKTDTLIS